MAKKQQEPSKSSIIRDLLKQSPKLTTKEVVSTLAGRGIDVTEGLVYFVRGQTKGRRSRHKKAQQMVAKVTATGNTDPVATILKVKGWANQVGGLKKLKALVDALSD